MAGRVGPVCQSLSQPASQAPIEISTRPLHGDSMALHTLTASHWVLHSTGSYTSRSPALHWVLHFTTPAVKKHPLQWGNSRWSLLPRLGRLPSRRELHFSPLSEPKVHSKVWGSPPGPSGAGVDPNYTVVSEASKTYPSTCTGYCCNTVTTTGHSNIDDPVTRPHRVFHP